MRARHRIVAVGVSVAVAGAGLASARAGAQWSPAVDVSSAATSILFPTVGFNGRGGALASWMFDVARNEPGGPGHPVTVSSGYRDAAAPAGQGFGPERDAPALTAGPILYARTRAVALSLRTLDERRGTVRLSAVFGGSDGSFGAPQAIDTYVRGLGVPALAANDSGEAIAAWIAATHSFTRRPVRIALRRPGHRFGRPMTLRGRGRANQVAAAVGAGGDMIVAYNHEGRIEARCRRAGHSWGRVEDLGPAARLNENVIRAAVAPSGRMYVVWSSQVLTEGGGNGTFLVRAAVRPAGRARFRPHVVLQHGSGHFTNDAGVSLALSGEQAIAAWSSVETAAPEDHFIAKVAVTDARARFRAPTVLSADERALVTDVAADPRGAALVVWTENASGDVGFGDVHAAHRPSAAAAFGASETVAIDPNATEPRVAIDSRTGRAIAVWAARRGQVLPPPPVGQVKAYLRAATRTTP